MEIVSTAVYVGPNVYAKQPLIRLTVDLHRRADKPVSTYADALTGPLFEQLPGLATATSELGTPLPERLKAPDCYLGELMAQVAIALQNRGGAPAEVALTRPAAHEDEVEVLYGYESEEIGLEAGEVARAIILELIAPRDDDEPSDIAEAIADFDHFASRRSLGPSALALVRAAEARDIPWIRLNDASLIQVGQGKYQKRIEAALTSQTSHTAVEIASDKELCSQLLSDLGLPVPRQHHVRDAEDAVEAANAIGFPVVVKPVDGNHGRGVSVNLGTDDEVAAAFEIAADEGSRRRRGEHDPRRRPPAHRHRRQARRRRPPHARPRRRRRPLHHRRARRRGEQGPPPRRRPREHADPPRARRRRRPPARRPRLRPRHRPPRGRDRLPAQDRQPLHRRHRHRRDRRHPPRQQADGRARHPRRRPRHRRRRLPHHRHHPELPRQRRRHLRDQRRPRHAHAHRPLGRQRPRRRRRGHGHALPRRHPLAHPDRRAHRHQRQDHHRPHARPRPEDGRLRRRPDLHRRRLHRRQRHGEGRHDRPEIRRHGAARPAGRHGRHRDRPRRHRPRRPRLPLLRRGGRAQRHLRPPRPRRRQLARRARRGQAPRRRGRQGLRRPQRRQRIHPEDGRPHPGQAHLLRHPQRRCTRWCASTSSSASPPWCWSRA